MRICVVGTGYVGLVSAACFAEWGHHVVAVDVNKAKIECLNNGEMPIYEPGLTELVNRNVAAGRLAFKTDLAATVAASEVVFITVGTPPRARDGEADLSFVYQAASEISTAIHKYTVVVTKSTVPVGTGDEIERIIARACPRSKFSIASNPEFLREGSAIGDFMQPDRVVIGAESERARNILAKIYVPLKPLRTPVIFSARRTAELIKYSANAFLAMRISFINEIADLCEQVGADVRDVSLGMGLDNRIGQGFLSPGPGYGGSCFPKDTLALLRTGQDHGVALRLVEHTVTANESRKRRMASKVAKALDEDLEGKTISILGLTFKANTDDVRDTPAIPLIEALQRAGAEIRAHDPKGMPNAKELVSGVTFCRDAYTCAEGSDALVVATDWPSFRRLHFSKLAKAMRGRVIVDLRNCLSTAAAERHGFIYHAIGQRSPAIRSSQRNVISVDKVIAGIEVAK